MIRLHITPGRIFDAEANPRAAVLIHSCKKWWYKDIPSRSAVRLLLSLLHQWTTATCARPLQLPHHQGGGHLGTIPILFYGNILQGQIARNSTFPLGEGASSCKPFTFSAAGGWRSEIKQRIQLQQDEILSRTHGIPFPGSDGESPECVGNSKDGKIEQNWNCMGHWVSVSLYSIPSSFLFSFVNALQNLYVAG